MLNFISNMPIFATNKRALYDYKISDKFEAGLKLLGHEVKSIKKGGLKLRGAYVTINQGQAFLINAHVTTYKPAGPLPEYDPKRSRLLLLNKKELRKLIGLTNQKGVTLVPLKSYSKKNLIKLEFGVGRGAKEYEKREKIKKRQDRKTIRRALKN